MSYPTRAQAHRNYNDNAAVLGIAGVGILGILMVVLTHLAGPVDSSGIIMVFAMAVLIVSGPAGLAIALHEEGRNPLLPVGILVVAMAATAVVSSILLGDPVAGATMTGGFYTLTIGYASLWKDTGTSWVKPISCSAALAILMIAGLLTIS